MGWNEPGWLALGLVSLGGCTPPPTPPQDVIWLAADERVWCYRTLADADCFARPEPDGRSSVVTEKDPHGKLYCLNTYLSDLEDRDWMPPGVRMRLSTCAR